MTTEAGWYPDPHDGKQLRYWSGDKWTDDVRPRDPEPGLSTMPPPAPGRDGFAAPASIATASAATPNPYVTSPSAPARSSNAGILVTIVASILVLGGAVAFAVMRGGDETPPSSVAAPTEPTDAPAPAVDLDVPNFTLWHIPAADSWIDASTQDAAELDPVDYDSFVGSWNIDGRVNVKTEAWLYAFTYPSGDDAEAPLDEVVATYYAGVFDWADVTVVTDEYYTLPSGIDVWETWAEGTCESSLPCVAGAFLLRADGHELWVTIYDYAASDFRHDVTEVMAGVSRTAES